MGTASSAQTASATADTTGHPIVFYDGVCGFCNGAVQFLLRHDPAGRFRFAALQGDRAREVLGRYGRDPRELDTMYVLLDADTPHERLLSKFDGALAVLRELGGAWKVLAGVLRVVPRGLRERFYDFIARNRYRWFGRYDTCPLPPPQVRKRFLDQSA